MLWVIGLCLSVWLLVCGQDKVITLVTKIKVDYEEKYVTAHKETF